MKSVLFLILFMFSMSSYGKTIKVAVLDTGFKVKKAKYIKLCGSGHKDFTGQGLEDVHGHGTNITGLVSQGNKDIDYCVVIVKIFGWLAPLETSIKALNYVRTLDVDIVNLSYGGKVFSYREQQAVLKLLDKGVMVVAAAGNEGDNLDRKCNYFPACYDKRIHNIGNIGYKTNYGKKHIDIIIDGNNKTSLGLTMSGTSQSAAIYTQRMIRKLRKKK